MSAPKFFEMSGERKLVERQLAADRSGLVIQTSAGQRVRPVLNEDEVVIMMGTGASRWLETSHKLPAVLHGMKMPESMSSDNDNRMLRTWFGKMTLLPAYQRMLTNKNIVFDAQVNVTTRLLMETHQSDSDVMNIGCAPGRRLQASEGGCTQRDCKVKPGKTESGYGCAVVCNREGHGPEDAKQCADECTCTDVGAGERCWNICVLYLPTDVCAKSNQVCNGQAAACSVPTGAPKIPAPATPAPVTPAPAIPTPATPTPATLVPNTPAPVPSTPASDTPAPGTSTPATSAPVTQAPGTPAPVPSTSVPETPAPITSVPKTPQPTGAQTPVPVATEAPTKTPAPQKTPESTPVGTQTPSPAPVPSTATPTSTSPVTPGAQQPGTVAPNTDAPRQNDGADNDSIDSIDDSSDSTDVNDSSGDSYDSIEDSSDSWDSIVPVPSPGTSTPAATTSTAKPTDSSSSSSSSDNTVKSPQPTTKEPIRVDAEGNTVPAIAKPSSSAAGYDSKSALVAFIAVSVVAIGLQ